MVNILQFGFLGVKRWGYGIIIPIGILFIVFIIRAIGAGDIKLFSVVGGLIGGPLVIQVILYSFIIGAILSVVKLIKSKNISYRMHYLANYISQTLETKKVIPYYEEKRDGYDCVIPFTIAIMGGFIYVMLFRRNLAI